MPEQKKDRFSPPAVGGVSLLVAFAVLALTVFALLSLSTVQADRRLADASSKAVQDYYAADRAAQEILARLRNGEDVEGVEFLWTEQTGTVFSSAAGGGSSPALNPDGQYVYTAYAAKPVRYTVPISDSQELQVEAAVYGDGSYEILRWQAVPVGDWEIDLDLDVWDGDLQGE